MQPRVRIALTVVYSFCLVLGCGPGEKELPTGLVPFSGTVSLDEKPVNGASIVFIPEKAGSGSADAGATTDDAGKFEVKSAEGRATGALPGDYRVVISRYTKPDGTVVTITPEKSPLQIMTEENAKESIPPQYSDFMRSKMKVTIPPSGGTHDFKLSSKK